MKPKQVKLLITRALKAQIESDEDIQPIFLWGPPGIGKSSIIREVCEEANVDFIDLRMPLLDPTDLRGIPVPQNGQAKWLAPSFLPQSGTGIISLEELPSAPPLVQVSAYQLTLDRKVGEYTLPDGYYVTATGNRIEDRAIVFAMSSALANRFTHIEVEVDVDQWVDWAFKAHVEPTVIGFIKFRSNLLFAFNAGSSEKAYPTPRTWEFTSRLLHILPESILPETMEGTVGKGATAEFMAFRRIQKDLPDLDKILAGDFSFVPTKVDIKYATISALATKAKGVKHFENLLGYSYKLSKEFAVLLVKMLAMRGADELTNCPSIQKWAIDFGEIFSAD